LPKQPTENIFGQTTFKKRPKKTNGQPKNCTAKFYKFGGKMANLPTLGVVTDLIRPYSRVLSEN